MKKVFVFVGISGSLILIIVISHIFLFQSGSHPPVSVTLPEKFRNKPVQLLDTVHFMQNDPKWNDVSLGGTHETLGGVGCTISSVAMALKNLGRDIDPQTLNKAITDVGGYTARGWLKWASIETVTDGDMSVVVYGRPSHESLGLCLTQGQYPVVKFYINQVIPHWVIVVGRSKDGYLIRDPLIPSPKPLTLRERTDLIYSIRCVRKNKS